MNFLNKINNGKKMSKTVTAIIAGILMFISVVGVNASQMYFKTNFTKTDSNVTDFTFKGKEEVYIVPKTGLYTVEAWGAQGASRGSGIGGKGAFSRGEVYFNAGDEIYVYVGGSGNSMNKGFNGGGQSSHPEPLLFGGGSTDIRVGGNSVTNRIMVAGGGGASSMTQDGGYAGGVVGGDGSGPHRYRAVGGSQQEEGGFRKGGFGFGGKGTQASSSAAYSNGGGGGGSGWYGGGAPHEDGNVHLSGAGGSSYVFTEKSFKPYEYKPEKRFQFINEAMFGGNESFFTVDGQRTVGNEGNGHLRISLNSEKNRENAHLKDIRINGLSIPGFMENKYEYTVDIDPEYISKDEITVVKNHTNQRVDGVGHIEFKTGNKTHIIRVYSEDGKNKQDYILNFNRKPSSKLFSLDVEGYNFLDDKKFHYNDFSYEMDVFQYESLSLNALAFDDDAIVTVEGLDNIVKGVNLVTIRVSVPEITETVYNLKVNSSYTIDFDFKAKEQAFVVPYTGKYKFDLWGAQGGTRIGDGIGGLGGFSSGEVNLVKGETVYLYTGGEGNHISKGFNGGGKSDHIGDSQTFGGGGTDIRVGGNSVYNRILVAGGGGGSSINFNGGLAGGVAGAPGSGNHNYSAAGATQMSAGGFRVGGFGFGGTGTRAGSSAGYNNGSGGGGGGWFGGGGAHENGNVHYSGAGGSGYAFTKTSHRPDGYNPDEKYLMTNVSDGSIGDKDLNTWKQSFIDVDGHRVEGHEGDGHIRITYYSEAMKSSAELQNIYINDLPLEGFHPDKDNYKVFLDADYVGSDEIRVQKTLGNQIVVGTGKLELKKGDFTHYIVAISEDGSSTKTYTIDFIRTNTSKLYNLKVDGFLFKDEVAFKDDVYEYEVDTFQDDSINISYEAYNKNSKVTITGLDNLQKGKNLVQVIVQTPNVDDVIYTININRKPTLSYSFKAREQVFIVPYTGKYKFDVWGAQGGSRTGDGRGGLGGFASGEVTLNKGETVYLYTGGEGNYLSQGFNGGGKSDHIGDSQTFGGGGTDIRVGGNSVYNRILVAGGGGGSSINFDGGLAGGLDGENGSGNHTYSARGASQKSTDGFRVGGFGYGGNGTRAGSSAGYNNGSGGGGGGWFGGGGAHENGNVHYSGAGGSGYAFTSTSFRPQGYNPDSKYLMTNTSDGSIGDKDLNTWKQSFIDVDGKRVSGHEGDGHIEITYYADSVKTSTQVNDIQINGKSIDGFDPATREYTIEIDGEYDKEQEFVLKKVHSDQVIVGDNLVKLDYHNYSHVFVVRSADKKHEDTYTINYVRKSSSKLAQLSVDEYVHAFTEIFKHDKYSYDLSSYVYGPVEVKYKTFDQNATVIVEGAREEELRPGNNKIRVKVSSPGVQDTIYEINAYRERDIEFDFSGKIEEFNIPYTGIYKFELWGAQGGSRREGVGGKGGYTSSEIYLKKDEKAYISIGGQGDEINHGFNGGGKSGQNSPVTFGGGASDIRFGGKGVYNRILVAGGGGASSISKDGGHGGGALGGDGSDTINQYSGKGGTASETSGFRLGGFGFGGVGTVASSSAGYQNGSGGGGGGWFGGGGAHEQGNHQLSGGGGSGYVYTEGSFKPNSYSPSTKYYMQNPKLIAGNETMPGRDGTPVIGNEGNGFARIALMNLYGTDSTLKFLNFSHGVLNQKFDANRLEYDLVLDSEQTELVISADTTDHNASVAWDSEKTLTINPGVTTFNLPVTAQDGSTRLYVVRVHRSASSNSFLSDLSINGEQIVGFSPNKLNYEYHLTYDQARNIELTWKNNRPAQIITGLKTHVLENNKEIKVVVISENTKETSEYTITPRIEDSNLLKSLVIDGIDFTFDENTFNYDLIVPSSISSLNITANPYDHEAKVTIVGNGYLRNGKNVIEVIVDEPYTELQVYTLNVVRSDSEDGSVDKEYDYIYQGDVQYFEAPHTGNFKLETWGAEGGNRGKAASGGKGGYSQGIVQLSKGEIVAVYVGGAGTADQKGFNGGGSSGTEGVYGGGASDVRVGKYSLHDRIIVAGGGGSVGAANKPGAAGGGLLGINNTNSYGTGGQGGSQTLAGTRGAFGMGGSGTFRYNGRGGAGGGGWYGGGGVTPDYSGDDDRGGGGGSGYVLTHESHKPEGYLVDAKYYLSDTETIAGNQQIPNKDGGYITGNSGNGFVRITALRRASDDNYLERIDLSGSASLEPVFDLDASSYNVTLDVNQTELSVKGIPMDSKASIIGNGTYSIPSSGKRLDLLVTSESGDVRTYTLDIKRPVSNNSLPKDIVITGLVPSLCEVSEEYCKLSPVFDPENKLGSVYSMIVPGRIKSVEFSVIKGHDYQQVIGLNKGDNGIVELNPEGDTRVDIEVGSEDDLNHSEYTFIIDRDMTGNADLEYLNIQHPLRDLEFNTDVLEYYISVPNEITNTADIDWDFRPMDPLANVLIQGEGALQQGSNEVIFTVVANNGQTKDYRLYIYREDSSNTFLNKLIVTHAEKALLISPSFNKTMTDYVLTVENDIDYVQIIAEAEQPDSTTIVNGKDGYHELQVGQNNISILTTAEDGSSNVYTVSIFRNPSNNSKVKNIFIDGMVIDTFDQNKFNQTIQIDSQTTKPNIQVTLESEFASFEISGAYTRFTHGSNTVHIRVMAEDGSISNYTIDFNKAISQDSSLDKITSNFFDISTRFEKGITEYEIVIPYSEEKMELLATASHHTSQVQGNGGFYLNSGLNELKLVVIAEDNTSTTYTLKINMLKNTNPDMQEITIDSGVFDPAFNPNLVEYNINVPNEKNVIKIDGVPLVASTKVEGLGEYTLNTGKNTMKINTTSESGRKKTYTLNVTRDVSSNADLSYLVVHEGALSREFLPGVIEYDVSVPYGTRRLTVEAAVQDPFASYRILNASDLKPGHNTVIVRVTPQDGVGVKDYTLNVFVQRESAENINLTDIKLSDGKLSPDFLPSRQFFRVNVGNEINSIVINAKTESNIKVEGTGTHQLKVGLNRIVLRTHSSNKVSKDYQIEVRRAPSKEARLKTLSVGGLTRSFHFYPDRYTYGGHTHLTQLKISAVTMHPEATYEIIGNHDFVTNNKSDVILRVTAEDGITKKDYVLGVNKLASKNNNLESISVSGVHITPDFNPARTTYQGFADATVSQVTLNAKTQDPNARLEMDKVHTLAVGQNFIDINVRAENNAIRKYTVVIDKEGSKVRDLSSLMVDGLSVPDFNKDKLVYEYDFPYEKESILIDYVLADARATVQGAGEVKLEVGVNKLPIVVTSENGDIKTYTLEVTRRSINSAKIKTLTVDNYPLTNGFDSNRKTYNLVIDNEFSSLRFDFELYDVNATYSVEGNENLQEGSNTIKIKVKSSEKDKEEIYTFNVFRQKFANNRLAYLEVDKSKLTPEFFGGEMVYNVELSYEYENITLTGETLVGSSKVEGLRTYQLEYGINHLQVPVTANNGVVRTYHVFVNRSRSNDNYLNSLQVKAKGKYYDLTTAFDPKTNEYTLKEDLEAGTEFVEFVVSPNAGSIKGHNQQAIKVGKNAMKIIVTSDSGLENTYTINLNRPPSSNNKLINILPSAGGLAPNFIYTENSYKLTVDTASTSLEFSVNTEDRNAVVTGHERQIVPVGISQRVIKVTAENGAINEYTIEVTKNDTNNAHLKNLAVNDFKISPSFDHEVFQYDLQVPNSKLMMYANEIIFETDDPNAEVELSGNMRLLTGDVPNVYEVRVTAVDGYTSETYRINITRESSKEALIEEIAFNKGELNRTFNPRVYKYDLEFTSDTEIFNKNNITRLIKSEEMATVSYSHDKDIVLEEGKVVPFIVTITSEDRSNVQEYLFNITYTRSKDNRLAKIELEGGQFEETFDPEVFNYNVNVHEDTRSIVVRGFARDLKAEVLSSLGDKELINFATVIEIKVRAENGDEAVYKLNVRRNLSHNIELKNIALTDAQGSKLSPSFNNIHKQYEGTVPRDNAHVGLIVEKGHESQNIKLYDRFNNVLDLNKFDLEIGRNQFRLVVESPFKDKREINILILRDGNGNTNLGSLSVTDPTLNLEFAPDKQEYFMEVENNYDSITILASPEVETSQVHVLNNQNLMPGNNDVIVRVKAENGNAKDYILHVFKKAKHDNFLSTITISVGGQVISQGPGFSPKFNPGITSYRVEVPATRTSVAVQGVANNNTTIVTGSSTTSETVAVDRGVEVTLKPGNNIVTLMSQEITEGNILTYTVNIVRKMSDDVSLDTLAVLEHDPELGEDIQLDFVEGPFDPKNNFYKTTVKPDTDALLVVATPANKEARVEISGNQTIMKGENLIKVIVTSQDRTKQRVYNIVVHKDLSSDASLKTLNIKQENEALHEFDLSGGATEHNYKVAKEIGVVEIAGSSNDPLADINGLGMHSLDFGNNDIFVTIKAQNGSIVRHLIKVFREYDNALESIRINQGELEPKFSPEEMQYTVWVPVAVEKINVEGIAANAPLAKVSGNGWYDLKMGSDNIINLSVQSSPDDIPSITNIKVIRSASANTNLSVLDITQGVLSPEFDNKLDSYETFIQDTHKSVDLTIQPEDPMASFEVLDFNSVQVDKVDKSKVKLSNIIDEITTIRIRVTAENGDFKDTTLKIVRQPQALFSNKLRTLEISPIKSISPSPFNPDVSSYFAQVDEEITYIKIQATPQSKDAKIVSGTGTFPVLAGRNTYKIVVRSKDGIDRIYNVIITQKPSADASLRDLSFEEGFLTPVYSRGRKDYSLNVGTSTNFLTPKIVPYANGTQWTVEGGGITEDLVMGENTVTINTTAADGIGKEEYVIKANKTNQTSVYLKSLDSNIGTFTETFNKFSEGPYRLEIDSNVNSIILSAKAEEPQSVSSIEGAGVIDMNGHNNKTVEITVKGNAGNSMKYYVEIVKKIDTEVKLNYLNVTPGVMTPDFSPDTTIYNVNVDAQVERIEINANATGAASITGTGPHELSPGKNEFKIVVTTNTGATGVYTINVERARVKSANILELRFKEALIDSPGFDKSGTDYDLVVPNEVESLTIDHIVLEDDVNSSYELIQQKFVVGNNKVSIVVTNSETKEVKTYNFSVTRQTWSSNFLSSFSTNQGLVSPEFNKMHNNYEIDVPFDVKEIELIGTKEDAKSSEVGLGVVKDLKVGVNELRVVVTSDTNVARTYILRVNRLQDDKNDLLTLTVRGGVLSPKFGDSQFNEYTINVDADSAEIEFMGTVADTASVVGLEKVKVTGPKTEHAIIVTAQNGMEKIYRFSIEKQLSSDANVVSIIPSDGIMNPSFSNELANYEFSVEDQINKLGFDVQTSSAFSKITGNDEKRLDYGLNQFTIKVVSEDGKNIKVFNIKVNRLKDIQGLEIQPDNKVMNVGASFALDLIVTPDDATSTDVTWSSDNELIASVDDHGLVTANGVGSATITVHSNKNPNIKSTVVIEVLNLQIESDVLDIVRNGLTENEIKDYVIGSKHDTKLENYFSFFTNESSTLHLYDAQGMKVDDFSKFVGTHMTVKLIVNGETYDELLVILRGDVDGDGKVTINDYIKVQESLQQTIVLDEVEEISLDYDRDGLVTVNDLVIHQKFMTGIIKDLNGLEE